MAENLNLNATVESWSDIVIKNWQRKIDELGIGSSGHLARSFTVNVINNAAGNPDRVEFAYAYYGTYVDMGVGREMTYQNKGNVNSSRRAKPWKSKVLYAQTIRLSQILAHKYGIIGASLIRERILKNSAKGDAANRRMMAGYFKPKSELSSLDIFWMKKNGLLTD